MKRFNQNKIQTSEKGKSNIQPPSFNKPMRGYYAGVSAAIFAIIVLHFAAQFVFFNNKDLTSEKAFAKTENEQIKPQSAEIKTEYKAINSDVVTTPPPMIRRESRIIASPAAVKKKQPREARAERLRRAEKILTGV